MSDLNLRLRTYVKGLRDTNASGAPTQPLDSTRSMAQDQATGIRDNASAKKKDLNTDYYIVLPA